jgi:hypothetical protein
MPPKSIHFMELERRVKSKLQGLLGAAADMCVTCNECVELEANGKYCFARRTKGAKQVNEP